MIMKTFYEHLHLAELEKDMLVLDVICNIVVYACAVVYGYYHTNHI